MALPHPAPERPAAARSEVVSDERFLAVLKRLVAETHPQSERAVTLESVLDRDLGLDSLARVELALRLQRAFHRTVSDTALAEARTAGDVLAALSSVSTLAVTADRPVTVAPPLAAAGAVRLPERATTLVEVLAWHAERHGTRTHVLLDGDPGGGLSYAALWDAARRVAGGLQARGVGAGERVALMLPTGRDYLACFYGCLLAGGVPVPIYPPARLDQLPDHLARHRGILASAAPALLVTVPEAQGVAALLRASLPDLGPLADPAALLAHPPAAPASVQADDLAFLQYTSGSTGDPKGVALTHANLLANLRAMGQATRVDAAQDVFVSWLPLYHDMGLIGAWLGSLYHALPLVLLPPQTFLARPLRWLQAITEHRGTLSAAPNFAYELCARRLADEDLAGLDLASWRLAFNGAEPVCPATLAAFAQRFAPFGFRTEALTPVYGLAECAVGLTFPPPGRGPRLERIDRDALERHGEARPVALAGDDDGAHPAANPLRDAADGPDVAVLPRCGRPLPGHELRVVDAAGDELPERRVGLLQFRGPSATAGYFRNPAASARLIRGGWLDTGDYGYLVDGEVVLTGRAKDIIIRAGRNLYPYTLEQAVGELAGVRRGCVAVFAARRPGEATERLVVAAETRLADTAARNRLSDAIAGQAVACLGQPPDDICLLPPHSVFKTSSGKIRRAACRAAYEAGTLGRSGGSRLGQQARYLAGVLAARLRLSTRQLADWAFAARAWGAFLAACLPAAGLLFTRPPLGRRLARASARLALKLAGLSPVVRGIEELPAGPHLLVVPHASYLDAVVLTAALPPRYTFVAKQELAAQAILGRVLRRLGTLFVARGELAHLDADVAEQAAALANGACLAVFAEGTFGRAAGLRPFRMGAFVAAARAGVPVAVAALDGTRGVLRDGHWLPRPGTLRLTVGPTLPGTGRDWAAAGRLRNAARQAMLALVAEPDLDER